MRIIRSFLENLFPLYQNLYFGRDFNKFNQNFTIFKTIFKECEGNVRVFVFKCLLVILKLIFLYIIYKYLTFSNFFMSESHFILNFFKYFPNFFEIIDNFMKLSINLKKK